MSDGANPSGVTPSEESGGERTTFRPGVFIVVPAYNEEVVLGQVLDELLTSCAGAEVVVVDDASTDDTYRVAECRPVHLLRHVANLGQGASLRTGMDYAMAAGAETIVTFDGDGQMMAEEVRIVAAPVIAGEYDVVFGTRFGSITPVGMPKIRRATLKVARAFSRVTSGIPLSDAHNGFRALNRKAAESIELTQDRMAHASEIAQEIIRLGLRWTEVPVTIRYTEYSRKKGQSLFGAVDIVSDLFWGPRR